MIPKIIHYCWFGRNPIPKHLQKCMDSWSEILPDYEIMRWDEESFDVESTAWTKEAYEKKKYAFVSDYVRLVALKQFGGIYFDTDVFVKKPFDSLLPNRAFMGFENDLYLTSAVMGFESHFPLVDEFLQTYRNQHFLTENGEINNMANVVMMTEICKKHGLIINNQEQEVADVLVLPKEFFCPLDFYHNDHTTSDTMTVHMFDASWLDNDTKRMVMKERTPWHKQYIRIKSGFKAFLKGK